jgi:ketosteroid isomerase-like protein
MSQDKVEVVNRAMAAFSARDLSAYDELYTSESEWFPPISGNVEGTGYRGRAGWQSYYEMLTETWEEFRIAPEELRDLGERVMMIGRVYGRGRGSGVPVDSPVVSLIDFHDGRISRIRAFLDHGEALRAAGLAEESG